MPKGYKKINVRHEDYIIFKQLKHRLQIDSDVNTFTELLRIAKETLNGTSDNINQSDGIAG